MRVWSLSFSGGAERWAGAAANLQCHPGRPLQGPARAAASHGTRRIIHSNTACTELQSVLSAAHETVLETTALCNPRSSRARRSAGHGDDRLGWPGGLSGAGASHPDFHATSAGPPIDVISGWIDMSPPPPGGAWGGNLHGIPGSFLDAEPAPAARGTELGGVCRRPPAIQPGHAGRMAARWPFSTTRGPGDGLARPGHRGTVCCPGGDRRGGVSVIRERWLETQRWVLRGRRTVTDREPALQRSIRLRNPYVDPRPSTS